MAVAAAWLAWNGGIVRCLAQGIHETGHFEDLPVLADALEEAGCTEAGLLEHLRGPGPHSPDCHVLIALLSTTRFETPQERLQACRAREAAAKARFLRASLAARAGWYHLRNDGGRWPLLQIADLSPADRAVVQERWEAWLARLKAEKAVEAVRVAE